MKELYLMTDNHYGSLLLHEVILAEHLFTHKPCPIRPCFDGQMETKVFIFYE